MRRDSAGLQVSLEGVRCEFNRISGCGSALKHARFAVT